MQLAHDGRLTICFHYSFINIRLELRPLLLLSRTRSPVVGLGLFLLRFLQCFIRLEARNLCLPTEEAEMEGGWEGQMQWVPAYLDGWQGKKKE